MGGMGLFWLVLIGLAAYLIYLNTDKHPSQGQGWILESPLEILKTRYARGEITGEQSEEMKNHLQY